MRALVVVIALCMIACTAPEGRFACTTAAQCPSGWFCHASDGLCYSTAEAPGVDAHLVDGGATDAFVGTDTGVDAFASDSGLDAFSTDGGLDAFASADAFGDGGTDAFSTITGCPAGMMMVHLPTGTASRCSAFGGLFLTQPGSTPPVCLVSNPYTSTCGCPTGFTAYTVTMLQGTSPVAGPITAALQLCQVPFGVVSDDWAGMFVQDESTGMCTVGNLAGSAGGCMCATPYTEVASWEALSVGTHHPLHIGFCGAASALTDGTTTFSGGYASRSPVPTSCASACLSTGTCMCPGTSTPTAFPVLLEGSPSLCQGNDVLCTPTF